MGAERGELVIEDLALPLALRFISGKYQGGEFPLPDSGEVVIGRSSELDMVLVEDMVSRRHAKISVEGGDIFLEDLGSTNGSFVNGEKITRTKLAEGDRILIGTSIIKVVTSDGSASVVDAQAQMNAAASSARPAAAGSTMTGSIAEVALPDLLQLESGFSPDTVRILEARGHKIAATQWSMGSLQTVAWKDGVFRGSSDPRRPNAASIAPARD